MRSSVTHLFILFGLASSLTKDSLALVGFVGVLALGISEMFTVSVIASLCVLGILFCGALYMRSLWPEKLLTATWPNVLGIALALVWIFFASFLFSTILNDTLVGFWIYASITILILITSIPSVIVHALLCSFRVREIWYFKWKHKIF